MISLKTQNHYFPTKFQVDQEFKHPVLNGHHLSIQNTARNFVMHVWLVFGSMLKFVHVEIVSL